MRLWQNLVIISMVVLGCNWDLPADEPQIAIAAASTTCTVSSEIITVNLPKLPAGARALRLVRIPAGIFQMGVPETEQEQTYGSRGPAHTVVISRDFYLGETEVTQAQWEALMGTNPAIEQHTMADYLEAFQWLTMGLSWRMRPLTYGLGPQYPLYNVSWDDCQSFIRKLNALGQGEFRLPSEAEWEYACRAGTSTRFSFGDALKYDDACGSCPLSNQYMWWCGNNVVSGQNLLGCSKPVATKLPNTWGLYDMHGNITEWCDDDWHVNYIGAPSDEMAWINIPRGLSRVLRGGSWHMAALLCHSAARARCGPDYSILSYGVRIAQEAP